MAIANSLASIWWARWSALLLALLLGLSAVYWGLRIQQLASPTGSSGQSGPTGISVASVASPLAAETSESQSSASGWVPGLLPLLGGAASSAGAQAGTAAMGAAVADAGHYRLTGVVAVGRSQGAALIAVKDQPARAVRVGGRVDDQWYLVSVSRREAVLGTQPHGPGSLTLQLPTPAPAPVQAPVQAPVPASAPGGSASTAAKP